MADTPSCAEVRALIPELAAGVAAGDERARALAHLAACRDCRAELELATAVVDELVLLAPEHEPSLGFENRVLAALEPEPALGSRPTVRRRLSAVALRAAALVLVAALAGGATWWHTADDRRLAASYRQTLAVANGRYLTAANLTTTTRTDVGHVFAYQGTPSWIVVTLTAAPQSGVYRIRLVTTDDRTLDVGPCLVTAGTGSYGTAIGVSLYAIRRIELVKPGAPTLPAHFA
jgi:Putative zinc-finger